MIQEFSRRHDPILVVLTVVWIVASASGDVRYRVRLIPNLSPSTHGNMPKDINESGFVVGVDDDGRVTNRSYRWNPLTGQTQNIGSIPTCERDEANVRAINDIGHVVGNSGGSQDCQSEAFFWTPEDGMIGIGDLPGGSFFSEAFDTNSLDQVVGRGRSADIPSEAFLWTPDDGMIGLGTLPGVSYSQANAINDSCWIAGDSGEAFLWRPGIGMMPLGGPDGIAGPRVGGTVHAMNELGQIVGDLNLVQPYFWDPESGLIALGRLVPGTTTGEAVALGINNHSHVVGYDYGGAGFKATIWDHQHGLRDLGTLLEPCYSPFARRPVLAGSINDDGWIAVSLDFIRGGVLIPYIPGDLDPIAGSTTFGDGDVDLQDLAYQLANFGRAGDANYAAGDLDCDQDVDLADLSTLLANFGETLP